MKRGIVFLKLCLLFLAFIIVLNGMLELLYVNSYIDSYPGAAIFNACFGLDSYRNDNVSYDSGNSGYVFYPDDIPPNAIGGVYQYNVNGIESSDVPYKEGGGVIENEKIDTIYIDWAYGNINIIETDDTAVSLKENLTLEEFGKNFMRYRTDGSCLEIRFMENGSDSQLDKELTVKLPQRSLTGKDYSISVTSERSDVNLHGLKIGSFDSAVEEGDVTVNNCVIDDMTSSSVMGSFYINSNVSGLTASVKGFGSIDCKFEKPAKNVSLSVYSGDITVRVPKDISGFLVKENYRSEGGIPGENRGFASDFNYEEKSDGLFSYGDESLFVNASLYSGGVTVRQIETK